MIVALGVIINISPPFKPLTILKNVETTIGRGNVGR